MPTIEIPNISIPEIKIDLPLHIPYQVLNVPPPSIKLPGCVKYHRDASPKNTALYDDDPTGTMISCPYGSMPTFQPMLYDRRRLDIVESKEQEKRQETNETIESPTVKPELPKEKKKIVIPECPGSKDQRVGDYRNAKKLEIVVGHRLDRTECITLYEDVPFKDQYIPSANQFVGVFSLALVGASAPLVLQLVRPLVKQAVSKLSKKKEPKS
tara:strand:- start:736 stop:1371 length:636 start_codon:yes stop_codon:yes gene_type:complete